MSLPRIPSISRQDMFNSLIEDIYKKNQFKEMQKLKQQELELNRPLKEAKAKEADMVSKLMSSALGLSNNKEHPVYSEQQNSNIDINQPYELNNLEKSAVSQMKPGDELKIGQSLPPSSTSQDKKTARDILISLGYLKESPSEQQSREITTAFQKSLGSNASKQLENWGNKITASQEMKPILEHNQEIMANPVFQEMYSHPEYMGYDISYLKKFGTPDQIELASALGTNTKSLFSSMASEFKGSFRSFEKQMFENAAPNDKDTLQQLIAKNNTMLALRDLMVKRLSLASDIVQSSEARISPNAALDIAEKQINAKEIRNNIKNDFKKYEQEAKNTKQSVTSKYSEAELMKHYNEAIAAGVPVEAANKRLAELRG